MKGNRSVSVYTGSLKLEIQIGSFSRNPRNAWHDISLSLSRPHSEKATARQSCAQIRDLTRKKNEEKKSRCKTKFHINTNFLLLVIFQDFIYDEVVSHAFLWLLADPWRESAYSVLSISVDEKLRAMPRARMRVARNGIFANVGKPGWSTGYQAVLGSPGSCCSERVVRRNRYSPCALGGAWKPGPSRAPSWPGSLPQPGPSQAPAATSCLLACCLLPELSLLRAGPGTLVLVPAR